MSDPLLSNPRMARLDRAWVASPCSTCQQSPCCRNLPITPLKIQTADDLLVARDLLGHRNIEIGIKEDGVFTLFYTAACRFLDSATSKCTIHGSDRQPEICRRYSADRCWYRSAFASTVNQQMIRLNLARLDWILEHVGYDDRGEIDRVPDWERMLQGLAEIPLSLAAVEIRPASDAFSPESGRATDGSKGSRSGGRAPGEDAAVRSGEAPVTAVDAARCLAVPPGRPRRAAHFDLIRFRLGFPGVRVGVGDGEWFFLLDAPPAAASALPHRAEYHLSPETAAALTPISYGELPMLRSLCECDEEGRITRVPKAGAVREALRSGGVPGTSGCRAS